MKQKLKGSLRIGHVSSSHHGSYMTLKLDDEESNIRFLEIDISMEDYGKLVGSNGSIDVEYVVRGKESIGMTYEHRHGSAKMPGKVYRKLTEGKGWGEEQKEPLRKWLYENAKEEGWGISAYLGSQNSIVGRGYGDESVTLNFTYFRYVDKNQTPSNA